MHLKSQSPLYLKGHWSDRRLTPFKSNVMEILSMQSYINKFCNH